MAEVALLVVPPGKTRAWLRKCLDAAQPGFTVRCLGSVEAACKLHRWAPRLVLVDYSASAHMRDAVRGLAQRFPGAALVVRADPLDLPNIDAEIDTNACAHIPASYDGTQVQLVLKLALSGAGHRPAFSPPAMLDHKAWNAPPPADCKDPERLRIQNHLTRREVEVLTLVTTGLSNRQTAVRLRIGENTVKAHLAHIFRKLKVDNRSKAILVGQRLPEVRRRLVEQGQRGSDVVASLSRHLAHRHHKCGHVIFRKGDPSGELYYLQRGIVVLDELGVELGPGDIFGEIGVFAPERVRTCSARCKTDVDLFCLDAERTRDIYLEDPRFALRIATLLAQRLLGERVG